MRANTKRLPFFFVMLAGAAVGFVLRRWQLRTAYDSSGLVISGSLSTWVLGIFSLLITLFFLWTARRLPRKTEYSAAFPTGRAELAVSLAAAALLLAGCVCSLMSDLSGFNLAVQFLGILSAFCILATAVLRFRGSVPAPLIHMTPCIYLVVRLIVDFKRWSADPAILDYCYELFAAIAAMCAVYHLGGFCFGRGQRRLGVFWCMACVVFSAVALADGGLTRSLLLCGLGLWAGVNGWQLLEP